MWWYCITFDSSKLSLHSTQGTDIRLSWVTTGLCHSVSRTPVRRTSLYYRSVEYGTETSYCYGAHHRIPIPTISDAIFWDIKKSRSQRNHQYFPLLPTIGIMLRNILIVRLRSTRLSNMEGSRMSTLRDIISCLSATSKCLNQTFPRPSSMCLDFLWYARYLFCHFELTNSWKHFENLLIRRYMWENSLCANVFLSKHIIQVEMYDFIPTIQRWKYRSSCQSLSSRAKFFPSFPFLVRYW